MKRLALAFALCAAAAPARAFLGFGAPPTRLTNEADLYAAGRFSDVVASLTSEKLNRMRKNDRRDAHMLLAESYERLGELDRALGVYQLAVRLFPRDLPLLTQQGFLLHRSGLHEQAKPLFERVLTIHPNNAAAHVGLAEIAGRLGFLDRSAEFYERALEGKSDEAYLWRDYAEILLKRRDLKTSLLASERALSLSREPDALVIYAQALRADGRTEDALARLDEALAQPEAWAHADGARLLKAVWLLGAGRFDEAAASAESVLVKDPREPLALWVRARVGLKRDRYNAAVRDLEVAAAAGKRAPFVARAAAALLTKLRSPK